MKALLLATVHRFDEVYAIEMRALDPATNEYLFTLKEDGKGKSSIPGMIDRLSSRAREQLRERPADVAGGRGGADVTTANLAAYEHFLKGRAWMNRYTAEGFRRSLSEFEAAVSRDPEFALAYASIAQIHTEHGISGIVGVSPEESLRSAKEAVARALALDPELASG